MAQFHEKIYQLLKNLLQLSPDTKHRILSWLGNCLHANAGRAKIWANQVPEIFLQTYASDSFFLNLGAALLRLCQPFCRPRSARLLTFNPTYCALRELNGEERKSRNVHMKGLDKETCLIPSAADQQPDFPQNYNLVTENLVLTQYTLHLGFHRSYLSKIKIQQIERDRGEWDSLTPETRREKESSLLMFGQLARFHNIMSNETIGTLAFLTSDIRSLFVQPVLAERIISMLNYFLQHLVGPKMGALKVKDFSEFDFKPQQLVSDICTVYLNLGEEENFCSSVPKDGRSYSPTLFAQTVRVLKKINKPGNMIVGFTNLAEKIKSLADQQQREEETYADAPDDFLDPIMSTVMSDPVVLPSSRVTVDRSTIARHLLSDQTDPFNRSPLTMDQIKPNVELKERIQQWLSERKQQREERDQESS
ncbi:hypothetical protein FKM82_018785 [Ascaphus truei]